MPGERYQERRQTDAPPETCWEGLQRAETWGAIGGVERILDVRHDEMGLSAYRFIVNTAGRDYEGSAIRTKTEPPKQMEMSISSTEVRGRIVVTIEPAGPGSEVEVNLTMEPVGLLSALVFPIISGAVAKGFPAAVNQFVAGLG
jgi:hypothetical protein